MTTTRIEQILGKPPPQYASAGEREGNIGQAVRDAYMLDTSAGQFTMLKATAGAFGVPLQSLTRRVAPNYSPFKDDLSGYENWLDEFEESTSPEETAMIKQMIDNNMDLRQNLEDYGGWRFLTGLLDPVNIIPVPFAIGTNFATGAKIALKRGAPIVGGTEFARHSIDPTSTMEETLFATLGGTLFMGLMGGAVGKIPKDTISVSKALNRLIPPGGTTTMFAGVPFHLGTTKGVFSRMTKALKSAVSYGEPISKTVDPERIKVTADEVSNEVFFHVDDVLVLDAIVRGGDTLQVLSIEVKEPLRGQGIGTAIYKQAIQYAQDNGLKFVSDIEVSAAAARRYKALEDEGFNVHENKNVTFDDEGTRFSTDSRPAFEIRKQIDPDANQIPLEVRETMDDLRLARDKARAEISVLKKSIDSLRNKVKKASVKGGAKTKAKNELKERLDDLENLLWQERIAASNLKDLNVKAATMLDEKTIKDWDLLPTGYNTILGKLDQFPWWSLMKTRLRDVAPDLAVKYQMFALKIAATPGLNNKGNRLGATTGPSVESLTIEYTGKWLHATREAQKIYRQYAGYGESSGQVKQFVIDQAQRVRSASSKILGGEDIKTTADGKLTIKEFESQISIAIAQGGEHQIPEVARAAAGYVKVLKKMGEEGVELGVFATQRNIARRIAKIDEKLEELNEKFGSSLPPGMEGARVQLEVSRLELEDMALTYRDANNTNYVHRMWLADEVIAQEQQLKAMLLAEFQENPKIKLKKDKQGNTIPEHPDVLQGRVNEAYASILRDAETGGDLRYAPQDNNKRSWLDARLKYLDENPDNLPKLTVETQRKIINGKLEIIAKGDGSMGGTGPLIARRLDLDDAKLVEMGLIEGNVNAWMNHYVMRTAPIIETARMFGDGKAAAHIDEIIGEVDSRAVAETDPRKQKILVEEAARGRQAMNELRDIVHGVYQIPDNPDAITPRLLRMLRNFNILGAMGRSVMMAMGDIGNVVVSQGFVRSLGHAIENFASGITDGKIKMMRDEVDLAGSVSEVILGMRYHQMTDFGAAVGSSTAHPRLSRFERGLANASQRFFLYNLLGPWTDMARRFSGGMVQSRIIENARLWKAGNLSEDQQTIMGRLGINREQAIQFADEWEASGSLKHKSMFIANTDDWISEQAQRTFRAAMNTEINRMVPTPGAVDKPKALLKSEWWKVIGQYRGFSIAATHRIMGAGLQTKGATKYSGLASMVGIAMMVDSFKRPDYIKMPIEQQVLRAVELSAVTGIILDINDTIERASAGTIGLRPLLDMDIRERNPNWANRMGTIGAVPNQWLTLMYGLTSDNAETDDTARAIRYMIPYNNLLWWNEAFNRAQRSSVDLIEDRNND